MGYNGEYKMSDYMDRIKKFYEWAEEMPRSELKYSVERLEYFEQELFKYAQFKVGDEVEIGTDLKLKEGHGWYSYRDRLSVGCKGMVHEVDHYNGKFRYDVTMDPQKENEGTFCIREETLKPNWDGSKNGE